MIDPATHVQIVICCKIWGQRVDSSKAMLFMLFERGNTVSGEYVTPTRVVSFGPAPLHKSVSTILQYWGVPGAAISGYLHPTLLGNGPLCTGHGDIDLYEIQEACLSN